MRGEYRHQQEMFLYATLVEFVPADHLLRPIRAMVDHALKAHEGGFDELFRECGRLSIALEYELEQGRDAGLCPCVYRTWARRAGLYEPAGEILP